MSQPPPDAAPGEKPIANLKIRFWGVQGSVPFFPEAMEVAQYEQMIARNILEKALKDIQKRAAAGESCDVESLLGGPINEVTLDAYQNRLGLSNLPVYGGDTTCISIETADGHLILLDGGTGIRNCSKFFVRHWPANRPRQLHIFASHEHLDHRSGLPFSQFCFVRPPFMINIYGSVRFLEALDDGYGIFSRRITKSTHMDDPIDYRVMAATFKGFELRDPKSSPAKSHASPPVWHVRDSTEPVQIGATTITPFSVYHGPVPCFGYKIEHGPVSFVFCTDHELRHGGEAQDPRQEESDEAEKRLMKFSRNADAAYFDGQYFREEYEGMKGIGGSMAVSRLDWGHGCIEDVVARAKACRIKRTFIGHHDPDRIWIARLEVDRWLKEQCEGQPFKVMLARSEDVVDL